MKGALFFIFILVTFASSFSCFSSEFNEKELSNRIYDAQERLAAAQKNSRLELDEVSSELSELLQSIATLQAEAERFQRVKDEELLGLNILEDRIQKWQEQASYQKQLLLSFKQQTGLDLASKLQFVEQARVQSFFEKSLYPSWSTIEAVDDKNELSEFEKIELGPITYAFNDISFGFLEKNTHSEVFEVNTLSSVKQLGTQLRLLSDTGIANIYFDPTLGNVQKLEKQSTTLFEHIERGGVWAYPILFFAFFALVTALLKGVQLLRVPKVDLDVTDKLQKLLKEQEFNSIESLKSDLSSCQQTLVNIALDTTTSKAKDDLLVDVLKTEKLKNEKYLGVITSCSAVAPLLGLLGTVSGMIHTFMMMNTFGSSDASVISGGISQALITTELGLIVAIPALLVSALLSRLAKGHNTNLQSFAMKLSQLQVKQGQNNV
ncbi:MotA/TolQ/ExbB proton channel family protein [Pseudoalteromonas phenolica]|uniref:MotA/TolQ/ExbB proton channel family protein n=1 Tax=Pseudoalteromonas phenolica TaxID=161398 RepID=UPI00110AB459|nr:MotA/TolQ/ExbB proton channel family protein [Pseudoalteromonas phenolica]TMO57253.1 hypothetical protein CWC21_05070 [Pseudoalteromonas phenolica]